MGLFCLHHQPAGEADIDGFLVGGASLKPEVGLQSSSECPEIGLPVLTGVSLSATMLRTTVRRHHQRQAGYFQDLEAIIPRKCIQVCSRTLQSVD